MKAIITVIDDNGKVICRDRVLFPVRDEIVDLHPNQPPIREARFSFVITELADFQIADFQKHKEAEDEQHTD